MLYFRKVKPVPHWQWAKSNNKIRLLAVCSRGKLIITDNNHPQLKWSWYFYKDGGPTKYPYWATYAGNTRTLKAAAVAGLQRMFSYRRTTIVELMRMLRNDQIIYFLAHPEELI